MCQRPGAGHGPFGPRPAIEGIPAHEIERVFERFVRLDEARARDNGGAGLGLAIARAVPNDHGGTLTATSHRPGGARLHLRLPGIATPAPPV